MCVSVVCDCQCQRNFPVTVTATNCGQLTHTQTHTHTRIVPLPAGYLFTLRLFSFGRHFLLHFFGLRVLIIVKISTSAFFFLVFLFCADNISKSNKFCLPSRGSWLVNTNKKRKRWEII